MGGVRAIAAAMYVNAALEGAIIVILSRGSDVCCCAELGDWDISNMCCGRQERFNPA